MVKTSAFFLQGLLVCLSLLIKDIITCPHNCDRQAQRHSKQAHGYSGHLQSPHEDSRFCAKEMTDSMGIDNSDVSCGGSVCQGPEKGDGPVHSLDKPESDEAAHTSTPTASHSTALAVVLYDEKSVRPHEKPSRTFHLADRVFQINQNWQSGGVAAVVWDAAVVLAEYFSDNVNLVKGKKVLELGAGTGLTGMVAASLGANVVLTERAEALPLLQESIVLNQGNEDWCISAKVLDWTHDIETSLWLDFDIVFGADIVYIEDTFNDLLRTIKTLVTDTKTKIFLSCRIRYERDTKFLNMLNNFYILEEVFYNPTLDIKIFSAVLKPDL